MDIIRRKAAVEPTAAPAFWAKFFKLFRVQFYQFGEHINTLIHCFYGNVLIWAVEGVSAGSQIRTGQAPEA